MYLKPETMAGIRPAVLGHVENEIIPRYAGFDAAHREDHAVTVISQAMQLWESRPQSCDVDKEVLLVAAAYHDLGLAAGRDVHHIESGRIIREDPLLKQWFTPGQIETAAQAAEDHRASGKSAPRSIYGMMVAEADRVIEPETIIRRALQFGLENYPQLDPEAHTKRAVEHLKAKYGRGGYLKLWIPWSDNAQRLANLQDMIEDADCIEKTCRRILQELAPDWFQANS